MVMHKVSAIPREAGAVQAMLLMLAALLPIMGTLTMLPVMPILFSHFAAQPHAQLLVPMIITLPAVSMALLAPLAGVAAGFVAQIGNGMLIPLMLAWMMKTLPAPHRATGIGIWHTFFFLGMFISPVLMTLLNGVTGSLQHSLLWFALLTLAIAGMTGIASARMGGRRALAR